MSKVMWDKKKHDKVQSIAAVLNEEMKNLNKGLEAFTREAGQAGYKIRIGKNGQIIPVWTGEKQKTSRENKQKPGRPN